ncbi:MAG: hypothetical protein ACPL3P_00125 [Anaerolineales bacterium]
MNKILLLDIDSVLIEPLGYRKAVLAVWEYITNLMGMNPIPISHEILADMEAAGITSEWDMLPLLIASLWQTILSKMESNEFITDSDIFRAAAAFKKVNPNLKVDGIMLPKFPLVPGQFPAETAWRSGLFPRLPQKLGESLLLNTRDPYLSQTTQLFQQFVLGSQQYRLTYQLIPRVKSTSYLLSYDRPLLPESIKREMLELNAQAQLGIGVITSRPSLPPCDANGESKGFAPEAEIALDLLGMSQVPLIGFGKMKYVGDVYNLNPDKLIKPAASHSLAAILRLFLDSETEAVAYAIRWSDERVRAEIMAAIPSDFEVYIVEDTLSGIISVENAVDLFVHSGKQVNLHCYGLTNGNQQKRRAFEEKQIPNFKDWETLWHAIRCDLSL